MRKSARIRAGVACAAAVVGLTTPFMFAGSADALGNNRQVTRSCGVNYVASGTTSNGAWAATTRETGDCTGNLYAALERTNGAWTTWKHVSAATGSVFTSSVGTFSKGLHMGCSTCNVTYS